jgi:superoxide dismutase, Cu-Zn family
MGVFGFKNNSLIVNNAAQAIDAADIGKQAVSILTPTTNNAIKGTVSFSQADPNAAVNIYINLSGAAPGSTHGLHIHAFGDVSSPTATGVGGHFNPFNASHACLNATNMGSVDRASRHAGDLGNIIADGQGAIKLQVSSRLVSLYQGVKESVIGRAVAVHAAADDCVTNPAGNSGARAAQGVIGLRNSTLPAGFVDIL